LAASSFAILAAFTGDIAKESPEQAENVGGH
jgi:hypothetical protein